MPRFLSLAAVLAALVLSGCSLKQSEGDSSGGTPATPPVTGAKSSDKKAAEQLGFPVTATRNTTRVSGSDAAADAAGVASALFPSTSLETRPPAIVLVDKDDWQGAVAAGALVAAPLRAPILLTDGGDLPPVTSETLDRLKPKGAQLASGAQAILVGEKPGPPKGLKAARIRGADQYAVAVAIDKFSSVARGKPSGDVVVASGEKPEYSIPAAGWAARSGDPVLFTKRDSLPPSTVGALKQHQKPHIFLVGPEAAVSAAVEKQLKALGKVTRIQGPNPVENAIAFARFKKGNFGWAARSGDPVLFTKRDSLPPSTVGALKQHQKPHIFLMGPEAAVSAGVEKQLKALGKVTRIEGPNPVENAIAFARFKKGNFGWGAAVPGQNLTIANVSRPGDAAAGAGLAANGIFAPILLTDRAELPRALESYLLDIQPGFQGGDPSQGVYNHIWILGGADALSPASQDRVDAAAALVPVDQPTGR